MIQSSFEDYTNSSTTLNVDVIADSDVTLNATQFVDQAQSNVSTSAVLFIISIYVWEAQITMQRKIQYNKE